MTKLKEMIIIESPEQLSNMVEAGFLVTDGHLIIRCNVCLPELRIIVEGNIICEGDLRIADLTAHDVAARSVQVQRDMSIGNVNVTHSVEAGGYISAKNMHAPEGIKSQKYIIANNMNCGKLICANLHANIVIATSIDAWDVQYDLGCVVKTKLRCRSLNGNTDNPMECIAQEIIYRH